MKHLKKLAVGIVALLFVFSAFACSQNDLDELSRNLTVYNIDAVFNDELKTLEVTQTVDYHNSYDVELYDIYFHLYPSAYREGARFSPITESERADAYPNGVSYGGITISALSVNGKNAQITIAGQDDDILIVPLENHLMPTQRVKISMTYTVNIPSVRHRLGYYNKTVNIGNFYPIACVYENGEFESSPYYSYGDPFYSQIANYNVSITASEKYTAVMSGITSTQNVTGGIKTSASTTAMRDFAIVLGEYEQKTVMADDVAVSYYFYNDAEADASLNTAAEAVKTFNRLFGEYPYKSLAVAQTHFLAAGMEYPGLTYISDAYTGEIYRDVIVHETAHQWWYGVVGNNQISHAWLDETLAEYSATLFYQQNPTYNVGYSARIADALSAYALFVDLLGGSADTSMSRRLPDFNSQLEYTFMTYTKGQIMMDTLRKTIGDDAFFAAFKNYYADNYLKIAKPDNLIAAFENTSGKDLSSFFETWLGGKVLTYGKE